MERGLTAATQLPAWPRGFRVLEPVEKLLLRDAREAPYLALLVRLAALPPLTAALYWVQPFSWLLAAVHFAVFMGLLKGFITGYHDLTHQSVFKPGFLWLDLGVQALFGTFMGSPPQSFFVHHVVMHHAAENGPDDVHSTMPYRRDDWRDFVRLWLRMFFCIVPMTQWHWRHRRKAYGLQALLGEGLWWLLVAALAAVSWQATVVGFLVPLFITRSLFILGNWAEHAFIDPADHANVFKNSITILNQRFNEQGFNVGYHAAHHLDPKMHVADLPAAFEAARGEYARQDAVVFAGTEFPQVWWKLMRKDYAGLAAMLVQLDGAPVRDAGERIAFLKSRLNPISRC